MKSFIEDQNGNHVVQKLIERLPERELKEIFHFFRGSFLRFSTMQYGCRVIQKLLEYSSENEVKNSLIKVNAIIDEIFIKTYDLCLHQYGNYVVQFIIERQDINRITQVIKTLRGKLYELSTHKFASNVIEKCLSYGSQQNKREIIEEIIRKDDQIR